MEKIIIEDLLWPQDPPGSQVQFETLESEGLSGDTVKPVVTTAAS